jgi:hypothetical protein
VCDVRWATTDERMVQRINGFWRLKLIHNRDGQFFDRMCSEAVRVLDELGRTDEQILDGLLDLTRDEQVGNWVRIEAAPWKMENLLMTKYKAVLASVLRPLSFVLLPRLTKSQT